MVRYATEWVAARDVIHARWPRLLRHSGGSSTREGFALSPVVALRPALEIGVRAISIFASGFHGALKSKLHVDFDSSRGSEAAGERSDGRATRLGPGSFLKPRATGDVRREEYEN